MKIAVETDIAEFSKQNENGKNNNTTVSYNIKIAPHGYDASMAFTQLSIRHDTILDHSILKYMAAKKVSYQGKNDENVTVLGAVTF